MPTATTTAKTDDAKALVKAHTDAVAERLSATDPGPRMRLTKRINALELTMYRKGIEFETFVAPIKASEKRYELDADSLVAEIHELERIADDTNAPGRVRTTAHTDANRLREQAVKRGIDVPDAS